MQLHVHLVTKIFYKELENYKPTRNCTENEIECRNSHGYKICAEEKVKDMACASYSTVLCEDDSLFLTRIETNKYFLGTTDSNGYVGTVINTIEIVMISLKIYYVFLLKKTSTQSRRNFEEKITWFFEC